MYTSFMSIARRVCGPGLAGHLIWIVPVCAGIAFLVLVSPPWRRREQACRQGQGRWPLVTFLLGGLMRAVVMITLVAFLAAALLVQKGLFAEKHGRVTERNLDAVETKWGVPHHQRDLNVAHYVMRKVVHEELADGTSRVRQLDEWRVPEGDEDRVVVDEQYFSDPPGVPREELSPRRLVRRVTRYERERVDQDSILRSEVVIDVTANPRRLGGAVYAGYNDVWQLTYTVVNRSERSTQVMFRFPLPAQGHGLYDRLRVEMDGEDKLADVRYVSGSLTWRSVMAPGARHKVEVGYASRGLGHFRYKPGDMREKCLVTARLHDMPASRLDFPIGSMPPADDLATLSGDDYSLHWDLSRAVSNQDIGIIVPCEPQPGYHVTQALAAGCTGVVALGVLLLVTRWLLSDRIDLLQVGLVLVGLYVAHALLANLNDVVPGFGWAYGLGMWPMAAAASWFWLRQDRAGWLRWQSVALVMLFYLFWPLLPLYGDLSGSLRYGIYAALVIYTLVLVTRRLPLSGRSSRAA